MDITTSYSSGRLVLHLSGELDHHGARGAMDRIEGYLEKYMPRDAVLDLAGLTFMDSSGIALIMKTRQWMHETGAGRRSKTPPASPCASLTPRA